MPAGTCQGETENRRLEQRQRPHEPPPPSAGSRAQRSSWGKAGGAGASVDPLTPPKRQGPSQQGTWSVGCWMLCLHSTAWGTRLGVGQRLRAVPVGSGATRRAQESWPGPAASGRVGRQAAGVGPRSPQRLELGRAWWGLRGQKQGRGGQGLGSSSLTWCNLTAVINLVCETQVVIKPTA